MLPLGFGACTHERVPAGGLPGTKLISPAKFKDERSLALSVNSAHGKERFRLMCMLADQKEKNTSPGQESLLEQINVLARELYGPGSVELAQALFRQGKFYFRQKEYLRSARAFESAKDIYAELGGQYDCLKMDCLAGQIGGERAAGACPDRIALYEELILLRRKCLGDGHPVTSATEMELAEIYSKERKYEQALKLFNDVYEKSNAGSGTERAGAALNIARTYICMQEYKKAEPLLKSVLFFAETHPMYGRQNPAHLAALKTYLIFYDQQKMYKEETEIARKIVAMNEAQMGPDHPQITSSLMLYAEALEKEGKKKESAEVRNRINKLEMAGDRVPSLPGQKSELKHHNE